MGQYEDIVDLYNKGKNKGQSILNSIFGLPTSEGIDAQKELMDYQNQLNTQQWERETAYNSPAEQMKRLREAGLNPDLAIGGNVSNTAGSSPSTSLGSAFSHPSSVVGLIDAFNNARLVNANITKAESEADLSKAQAEEVRHRSPYIDKSMEFDDSIKEEQRIYWSYKSRSEYQEGLSKALSNWSKGIIPDKPSDGIYNAEFQREFYELLRPVDNIITDVMNEYHINRKDREYLDQMFEAMVSHDKEAFEAASRQLRASSAIEQFKADNSWFQFVDYFFTKLLGSAQGLSSAYSMYQLGRRNARN